MDLMIIPDILLLVLGFKVIAQGLFVEKDNKTVSAIPFHTSWIGLTIVFVLLNLLPGGVEKVYFGTYKVDTQGILLREFFTLSALVAVLFSRSYFLGARAKREALKYSSEFMGMIILCTFGAFAMVSATDLITLFIGLELATIPLYFLTAYHKMQSQSMEAATKYILIGSASTAIMLFGFSYLYGVAGSVKLDAITAAVSMGTENPLVWLSVLLIFAAIGFKMTLFPFHMWAPDVYEGAPTPVTAFLSVSSKAVAIAFLMIMVYGPFAALHDQLEYLILLLAGTTMTVGNLGAMRQRSMKRFLGYSSVAQAGYIMLALAGPEKTAISSIIFYLFVYGVTNYLVFFIFSIAGEKRGEDFSALRGLSKQSPALAAILSACMFSLAGIPPVAGFLGKFLLFSSAAEAGYYGMIIFAAANSTVSLYYYLLVLREAYIEEPEVGKNTDALQISFSQRMTMAFLTVAVLALGLFPQVSDNIYKLAGL